MFDPPPTKADFDAIPWKTVLKSSPKREISSFASKLVHEAIENEKAGRDGPARAFQLLAQVCSMHLVDDESGEVFRPTVVLARGRSLAVEDLSEDELQVLASIKDECDEPEFRARVADILWVRRRDHLAAREAIAAYLESAAILEDPGEWPPCTLCLKRAVHLAALLGRGAGDLLEKAASQITQMLDRYQGTDSSFLSMSLMEILQEQELGEPNRFAGYAEIAANRAEQERNWHRARLYWQTKARWHKLTDDATQESAARIRFAETFASEVEEELAKPSPSKLRAIHFLGAAVKAFRQIPGGTARANGLKAQMESLQPDALAELKPIKSEIEIRDFVERAEKTVTGKSFVDAVFALATICPIPDRERLRSEAKRLADAAPFSSMFPLGQLNASGRVVARRDSVSAVNSQESDEELLAEMLQNASTERSLHATAVINPARRIIHLEHAVMDADLLPVVRASPFVPPDREGIFARGLGAGFRGDLLVAAHLLVPQLENSIRVILREAGAQTLTFDAEGVQKERSLTQLLSMPETAAKFGDDLTFDLLGLLVDEWGSNLRDRLAHGLIGYGEFYSAETMYAWWLSLRLCCLPILATLGAGKNGPSNSAASGAPPEATSTFD